MFSRLSVNFVNLWFPLRLSGRKQGNFQFLVELPAHDQTLDLRDDDIDGQQDLGALYQMTAVGVSDGQ